MEPAIVTETEDYEFQIFGDEDDDESMTDDTDEDGSPSCEDIEDIPSEPPAKRRRISSTDRKTCCVKGCQKSHFWSKKWVVCPKCKKNFCPLHAKKLQRHKC